MPDSKRMDTTCRITGLPATHTYIAATGERTYINLAECIARGFGDPRKIASVRETFERIGLPPSPIFTYTFHWSLRPASGVFDVDAVNRDAAWARAQMRAPAGSKLTLMATDDVRGCSA